jgi:5S rRNA maturation endonuclease (ribonuclease M5)
MTRINQKLILASAPPAMGEQVHINHTGCEAGEDTKKRLYIKRVSDGILAYCHHCNQRGFVKLKKESHHKSFTSISVKPTVVKPIPEFSSISEFGWDWLNKYYVNSEEDTWFFTGVRGQELSVGLRLLRNDNTIGWQIRNLFPTAKQPRYTTHYITTAYGQGSIFSIKDNTTLVICEDYLSAYRVFRDTNNNSIALLGTNIMDSIVSTIYDSNYNKVIIWLDPDTAGITAAKKIFKKLSFYLPNTTVIKVHTAKCEPKELSPSDLSKELDGL